MKLPFAFGLRLIYRLAIPGFFLSLGLWPVAYSYYSELSFDYAFPLMVVLAGWLVSLADMPIYMMFEGRRFWPIWLLRHGKEVENMRLQKAEGVRAKYIDSDSHKYIEALVELRKFPLGEASRTHVASRPTRLGNVIDAYEQYSYLAYGMDAVFYWYRIWIKLPKDIREEIDTQQAIADSAVYASLSLYVVATIFGIYWALSWLDSGGAFGISPSDWARLFLGAFILGYSSYRIAIHLHASFGETFKSVFDQYRTNVDVSAVVQDILRRAHVPVEELDEQEKYKMAWRYLQHYLYRCSRCSKLISANEIEEHVCTTLRKKSARKKSKGKRKLKRTARRH